MWGKNKKALRDYAKKKSGIITCKDVSKKGEEKNIFHNKVFDTLLVSIS